MKQLPQGQYNFNETEEKILKFWNSKPFFKPEYDPKTGEVLTLEEMKNDKRETWTLICPPPNAYDRPHIGNLSGYAYQDALARYNRLLGKKVIMIPGKDHAGLEGEATFVRDVLDKQGKKKSDFARDEFYKQVYDHQQNFIEKIRKDEQSMGLSADFDRELYTLDPRIVETILSTFIEMYHDGLIYKGVRIVNWDIKAQSTIPDNQCERLERQTSLHYIKYKLADGSGYLSTATTRPETLLGDTALVVHPNDERYKDLIGKKVIVPLCNREIPIITNGRIEKEFGTGVLKCTPSHASEDYEIMLEWNQRCKQIHRDNPIVLDQDIYNEIEYINVIDKNLKMVGPIPEKYKNLKVNSAREEVVKDLKELGLIEKTEEITQNVLISERTGIVVEPLMTSQWFMDVSTLKKPLIEMVLSQEVKIHPKNLEKKFFAWVEKMRDWAISRNLWWGYRLPVWYNGVLEEKIDENGKVDLYLKRDGELIKFNPEDPSQMKVQLESPGEGWIQDDDILDTWFSSGQWPIAVLKAHDLLDISFPTNALVSADDILVKWDLTMMLFSYYKTKKAPFQDLYLTGLVKGTDGQKMSKSKKNFIPLDDTQKTYGIDAFRMNCFYQNKAGKSYAITAETLKNFRNFNNKIWNASKYVMMNLEGFENSNIYEEIQNIKSVHELEKILEERNLTISSEDKNFLIHLENLEKEWGNDFSKFRFGLLTEKLYSSFWHEFCDIYIEKVKPVINLVREKKEKSEYENLASFSILYYSLKSYLKMLHPFTPFITEEIWQNFVENGEYEKVMMYQA